MSNAMKYIRDLEAAGFQRDQAEAQVQMVLDAMEGDLVTKSDFAVFQERLENRFSQIEARFVQLQQFIHSEIAQLQQSLRSEFTQGQQSLRGEFTQGQQSLRSDINEIHQSLRSDINEIQQSLRSEIKETEFRMITRLGVLTVSTTTIAVAILTWLIKM